MRVLASNWPPGEYSDRLLSANSEQHTTYFQTAASKSLKSFAGRGSQFVHDL
jgi:hypothetical protein